MDLSIHQLEYLYQQAMAFAAGTQTKKEAAHNIASRTGMSLSSAMMNINGFRHMVRGERYRRTININITDAFLERIYRDSKDTGLSRALAGLLQHIQYYEAKTGTRVLAGREIYTKHRALLSTPSSDEGVFPEEVPEAVAQYREGAVTQVTVNKYERSATARKTCLEAHGYACAVCEFDFGAAYGAIGHGFIHVHHLIELSSIGETYEIDPVEHLRPVCPNCHAMLHRRMPALSIDELRVMLTQARTDSSRNR